MQRAHPPGGGQPAANHEIIANNLIHYKNIISQQDNQLIRMEKLCMELKNELDLLEAENRNLKKNNTTPKKNDSNVQYETDEDELARETEWILKKRLSKKKKAAASPEIQTSNSKLTAKPSFEQKEKKIPRPPPIMISGECDYQQIFNIAKKEMKKEFLIKLLNNNTYKIKASDPDDYRSLTKMLTSKNLSWYTHENKQSRPIKVMVKNLHHTSDPEEIISYLQKQGLKAISAVNKLKWKTREPLDMFLLTFDSSENIKKIHEIKTILHSVVTIEAVRKSKLIPQCKSCQAYGHTQNYCGKQPRCVKCAGKHKSIECTKPKQQQPKCCNCGEAHPASYRGCVVAKELQKIRDQRAGSKINKLNSTQIAGKNINKKLIASCPNNLTCKPFIQNNTTSLKRSTISQVVKENNHLENANILQQILEKITTQNEYMTALEKRLHKLEKPPHLAERKD